MHTTLAKKENAYQLAHSATPETNIKAETLAGNSILIERGNS